MSATPGTPKPLLRGWLHEAAFVLAVPAAVLLVLAAQSPAARVAAIIYGISLAGLFGVSAVYHRLNWSPSALRRIKQLDHSMIFLLIAGSYTPFALLVIGGAWGIVILSTAWTGALVGIALKLVKIDGLRAVGGALYITLGWLAILALPKLLENLSAPATGLVAAGAVLYTAGAVVLLTNRPDPSPRYFGYHEVWHTMVIGASACFYAVILLVMLGAA